LNNIPVACVDALRRLPKKAPGFSVFVTSPLEAVALLDFYAFPLTRNGNKPSGKAVPPTCPHFPENEEKAVANRKYFNALLAHSVSAEHLLFGEGSTSPDSASASRYSRRRVNAL
jgi:hypothetical protein